MKNKLSIADIVITALFAVVACCGIGVTVARRIDKGSGVITTENYQKFLSVNCSVHNGWGGNPYEMEYEYTVKFAPADYYELSGVTVKYALESEYSDLGGTYSHTFTASYNAPATVTGTAKYNFPSHLSLTEVMGIEPQATLTVLSVSGNYRYVGGEK